MVLIKDTIQNYIVKTSFTNYNAIIKHVDYLCNLECRDIHMGNNDYYANINVSLNNEVSTIYSLKYNKDIDIIEELEKTEDSGIKHIVYTIMNLTLLLFPHIKYFELSDNSLKSCYQSTRIHKKIFKTVDLGLYYVAFYNNTWYNKVFKMNLKYAFHQIKFTDVLNKLASNKHKKDYEWFYDMILSDYFETEQLQKYQELYNIEKLYTDSNSYYDFFKSLKTTINNENELCLFMTYFIAQFMNEITCGDMFTLLSAPYMLESNNIEKIDIEYALTELNDFWNPELYDKHYFIDMIRLTCTTDTHHWEDCNMCYLDKTR